MSSPAKARPVRAPRGSERSCKGWVQEAALRMLMNNLDPDVAERPEDLVVYGGTGRAARDWAAFDRIVAALRALEHDPKTRWRVTDTDWERFKLYDRFRKVSENALRETSTAHAPWIVVEVPDHFALTGADLARRMPWACVRPTVLAASI